MCLFPAEGAIYGLATQGSNAIGRRSSANERVRPLRGTPRRCHRFSGQLRYRREPRAKTSKQRMSRPLWRSCRESFCEREPCRSPTPRAAPPNPTRAWPVGQMTSTLCSSDDRFERVRTALFDMGTFQYAFQAGARHSRIKSGSSTREFRVFPDSQSTRPHTTM
jgi:hypothetical protein